MRGSLSFVSFVVLVNGNAKRWVKASRELIQGDPLSPFLFTIIVDVLSRLMLRAVESGLLEGFGVGRSGTTISHLQFANATIRQRTEDSQLSLFTRFWIRKDVKIFLQTSFGILWCLQG